MVIAVLLGIILARTLTQPVRDLTRAIEAMSRGELRQEVPVRSRMSWASWRSPSTRCPPTWNKLARLRRQMTADIAHDLRSPLSVLSGYAEALSDGKLPGTPGVHHPAPGDAQLSRLVEDLRLLSLADAGELQPSCNTATRGRCWSERLPAMPSLPAAAASACAWRTAARCPPSAWTRSAWRRCWITWCSTPCATRRRAARSCY